MSSFASFLSDIGSALGRNWWWGAAPSAEDEFELLDDDETDDHRDDREERICMSRTAYERLVRRANGRALPVAPPSFGGGGGGVGMRDRRVVYDDFYPPYGRSAAYNYDPRFIGRVTNLPTQAGAADTYRLVGYLNNPSASVPTWKVFGRQRDRNRADFYMTPAYAGYDMKLQITDEIVVGRDKFRDLDTIPSQVTFSSPMLESSSPYTFVELPKSDLRDGLMYF